MTYPEQNQSYGPTPQTPYGQSPYGQNPCDQQQNPYGQQPQQYAYDQYGKAQYANSGIPAGPAQPAYSEIPDAPAEKAANTEETRKAPVASIIFLFIATSLMFFRYLILFADGNTSATNILFFMLAITACILMILGLFIRKATFLYGVGLFLLAGYHSIDIVMDFLGANRPNALSILSVILVASFLLSALYYVLRGKGINKVVKLIFSIVGLVSAVISTIALFGIVADYMDPDALTTFAVQLLMYMLAFVFIWIATMAFTPFRRERA